MNPSPLLAEAARLASAGHRQFVASVMHLEAAGAVLLPETEEELAVLLDDADAFAEGVRRVAAGNCDHPDADDHLVRDELVHGDQAAAGGARPA